MIPKPKAKLAKLPSKQEERTNEFSSEVKRIFSREKSEGEKGKLRTMSERSPDNERKEKGLRVTSSKVLEISMEAKSSYKFEDLIMKTPPVNIKKIMSSGGFRDDDKKIEGDNPDKLPRIFKQKMNTLEDDIQQPVIRQNKKKQSKGKAKNINIKQGSKLNQVIGIPMEIKSALNPEKFAKYKSYVDFIYKVNLSNNQIVNIPNDKDFQPYKCYIGKGNNGLLVKNIMKNRWWWTIHETQPAELDSINFIWTQLRMNNFLDLIKPYKRSKAGADSLDTSASSNTIILNSTNGVDTSYTSADKNDSSADDINLAAGLSDSENSESPFPKKSKLGFKLGTKRRSLSKSQSLSIQSQPNATLTLPRINATPYTPKNVFSQTTKAQDPHLKKLLNNADYILYMAYMLNKEKEEKGLFIEDLENNLQAIKKKVALNQIINSSNMKIHNHLENNFHLHNKRALYYNMKFYYEAIKEEYSNYLPVTFHIQKGFEDPEYNRFLEYYNKRNEECINQELTMDKKAKRNYNVWIVKPGEMTNRGTGITVCKDLSQIKEILNLKELHPNGRQKTYIVQQYIDHPLLYNKRKFDIRCYLMLTSINGILKGYWFQEGYIRTSSKEFSIKNVTNKLIHLTNDAVQKKGDDYGKFESGNKISYLEFQRYLDLNILDQKVNFLSTCYPQMKKIASDCVKAVYGSIDPNRRENCFEIFGLDFMIDDSYKVWLIEVNTNPCLELSSPLLGRLIPSMVENGIRIALDSIFPPPHISKWPQNKKPCIPDNLMENNKFELIFDELQDGPQIKQILINSGFKEKGMKELIYEIEEESESELSENEDILTCQK